MLSMEVFLDSVVATRSETIGVPAWIDVWDPYVLDGATVACTTVVIGAESNEISGIEKDIELNPLHDT